MFDTENGELKRYVVTRAHNLDYVSATAMLTLAENEKEAIIACMEHDDLGIDDDEEYENELLRLRSLSLYELEQDDRDNGNVWHADLFKIPSNMKKGDVVIIAKLDTD